MLASHYTHNIPDTSDAMCVMGTARPVGDTGERCPSCQSRDLVDRIDSIGRVTLRCLTCNWREAVRSGRTPPPDAPIVPLAVEERAELSRAEPRARATLTIKAREMAATMPTEWTPLVTLAQSLGQSYDHVARLTARAMHLGLVQRDLRDRLVPQGKGALVLRKGIFVRRVA